MSPQLTKKDRPNSRAKLLQAATEIVAERGGGRLTLDAVAERAGISKGGLLYNFPSKDALLSAMIADMVAYYEQLRDSHYAALLPQPHRFAHAMLATLNDFNTHDRKVAQGLLATISEHPDLLQPVREKIAETFARLQRESEDPGRAVLAWLAMEGLCNLDLLTLSPLSETQRLWAIAAVHTLLEGQPVGPPPAS